MPILQIQEINVHHSREVKAFSLFASNGISHPKVSHSIPGCVAIFNKDLEEEVKFANGN